jgi:hypothetical protein
MLAAKEAPAALEVADALTKSCFSSSGISRQAEPLRPFGPSPRTGTEGGGSTEGMRLCALAAGRAATLPLVAAGGGSAAALGLPASQEM